MRVDVDRDGRNVSARRVTAIQEGEVIFSLSASFQTAGDGPELDHGLPEGTPDPESITQLPPGFMGPGGPFEIRPVSESPGRGFGDTYWARTRLPMPDDPALHACVLSYLSDLGTGLGELRAQVQGMQNPSLDHAVWFHRHIRMDDWVLFDMRPLSAHGGRCLYTGALYGRDGTHGATIVQECLFRPIPPEMLAMMQARMAEAAAAAETAEATS